MRSGGSRVAGALVVLASFLTVAGPAPAACAADGPRAVLVVDTGDAEHRMCVALPRAEVSGIDLIVLAGEQHGLSFRFGYGGGAVCMLAGVGTAGDDCFERYPDFWGYWRGNGSGGWSWSSTGAGSTRVGDGDVEGWSWGSGSDGSSHPAPPATSFSAVCAAGPPSPAARRAKPRSASKQDRERVEGGGPVANLGDDKSSSASVADAPDASVRRPAATDPRRRRGRGPRGRVTQQRPARDGRVREEPLDAAIANEPTSGGPPSRRRGGLPPAGLAALTAAVALGGAGAWVSRRRRLRS